jgi:hypothetical protein
MCRMRRTISSDALAWPSCGYPLNEKPKTDAAATKALMIVAVCFGLFGAVVGFTTGNPVFGSTGAIAVVVSTARLLARG